MDECTKPYSRSITGLKEAYENFEKFTAQFKQQSDGMPEYQSEFSRGAATLVLEMEAELRKTVCNS